MKKTKRSVKRNIKRTRKKKRRIRKTKSLYFTFHEYSKYWNNFFRNNGEEEEQEEGEVVEPHPLVTITDIKPEDIPEVPTNKFLMRGGDSKDDKKGGKTIYFFW